MTEELNCLVYLGCKMTGLLCDEMVDAAQEISVQFVEAGLSPYHPVLKENIPHKHEKLKERTKYEMNEIWESDKVAIHNCHVLVDTAPHIFSAGLKEEIGKARYRDWKPTVAIWPADKPVPFITLQERDFVTSDSNEAAYYIADMWGTRWRRMKWRLPIYMSHLSDISLRKIVQFFL